jgi:hypothetical protein
VERQPSEPDDVQPSEPSLPDDVEASHTLPSETAQESAKPEAAPAPASGATTAIAAQPSRRPWLALAAAALILAMAIAALVFGLK